MRKPKCPQHIIDNYKHYKNLAELYYGFHYIQQYVDAPFTNMVPEALFNISRFLLNRLGNDQPFGISRVYIMFTMAKHANTLEAYKLAREAYQKQPFGISRVYIMFTMAKHA